MWKSNQSYWLAWLFLSLTLAVGLYDQLAGSTDPSLFMPGPLSDGHHQFTDQCEICHAHPFDGSEAIEQRCVECHGETRVKPHDSHPKSKFDDPRNADLLAKIDASSCMTCHQEHKTAITLKDGFTQPVDFCAHCHANIGEERPSHADMAFSSCKDAGCHNFHNNRAIYTDFLIKHLDEKDLLDKRRVKAREFARILEELMEYPHDDYPVEALTSDDADAPGQMNTDPHLQRSWAASSHAKSGVNCSACHSPDNSNSDWSDTVPYTVCQNCHHLEVERFQGGRHGMRWSAGLPDMPIREARLLMRQTALHQTVNCHSCHNAHDYDSQYAAVDACVQCHADQHTQAYEQSPHARLWAAERENSAPPGSGVSCATCHMPRIAFDMNDWASRIMVDHNQSANLSPNTKMARTVCLHCHGLDFTLKALADPQQILNNFATRPKPEEHPSMQLARRDHERYLREINANPP